MWERTDDFLQTVQEFAWISSFRTCRKASKNGTVLVESTEIHEPVLGTQIVTHDTMYKNNAPPFLTKKPEGTYEKIFLHTRESYS